MTAAPRAAVASGLDPAAIARRVEAVLAEPLYWFPVRHHSPTVARLLRVALRSRRPKVVFIEGPAEANDLIRHVVDRKTEPPIAIYSSYRDDANVLGLNGRLSPAADIPAKFAAWYPLTSYSPEYVAMKTAESLGAEAVFIDLPHFAQVRPREVDDGPPESPPPASGDDRLITTSGFFRHLTEAAGFRSWPEAWDTLFEDPTSTDPEAYRRELATFCLAARLTPGPRADHAEMTIERERHFLKTIRETLAARNLRPEDAAVVCGGFHLFLDRGDATPPPATPAGTTYTAVVPYSYFRISELAGYGAGVRAPQFYQACHDLTLAGRAEDVAMEHAIAVLRRVRRGGDASSTADAIVVTHHAKMLARLRGRRHATLDDIEDALITCCCKGDPADEGAALRTAMDAAGIGTRIGKVTPALGRLPIVADFHDQVANLGLADALGQERRRDVRLDKRDPLDSRRSAFFHRLAFLGVPFASRSEPGDRFSATIFREDWAVKWDPRTEPALIEQNLHGDTIDSAALARLREAIAGGGADAARTCRRLVQAVEMDLPELVHMAEAAGGRAIDADASFVSLASALQDLGLLDLHASFRALRRDTLEGLFVRAYGRACFALPAASAAPDEEHPRVVDALLTVADLLQRSAADRFDRDLFFEAARRGAEESPAPFLRGAFLGLLCEIRELPPDALAAEVVKLARAAPERMVAAGDLLDGMLATSRTSILLGADALVAAVDDLLTAAQWEPFLVMLPRLRAAFERLNEPQRDSLAAAVARRHGLADPEDVRAMTGGLAATALVARLDAAVAEILRGWPL